MPRRREIAKREVPADPIYDSPLVTKFIRTIMQDGKRSTAERIMYGALNIVKDKTSDDPLKVFKKAVDNVKPALEVKSRRVGGSNYQVPIEVDAARQTALAMRWIVQYSAARKGVPMQRALAMELMDAAKNTGNVIKKRDDTHKMAQANKAFAHYRW